MGACIEDMLKQLIFELSLLDNGSDNEKMFQNQVTFAIKLDKSKGIRGKVLLQIRTQIAMILHISVAAFKLCSVDVCS